MTNSGHFSEVSASTMRESIFAKEFTSAKDILSHMKDPERIKKWTERDIDREKKIMQLAGKVDSGDVLAGDVLHEEVRLYRQRTKLLLELIRVKTELELAYRISVEDGIYRVRDKDFDAILAVSKKIKENLLEGRPALQANILKFVVEKTPVVYVAVSNPFARKLIRVGRSKLTALSPDLYRKAAVLCTGKISDPFATLLADEDQVRKVNFSETILIGSVWVADTNPDKKTGKWIKVAVIIRRYPTFFRVIDILLQSKLPEWISGAVGKRYKYTGHNGLRQVVLQPMPYFLQKIIKDHIFLYGWEVVVPKRKSSFDWKDSYVVENSPIFTLKEIVQSGK
jgi:hypothetical protein